MQSRASTTTSGPASPFAQVAAQDHAQPKRAAAPKKPGFLGRLCACGQAPAAQEPPERENSEPAGQPLETTTKSTSGQYGIRVSC